jgi:hypothetical protein
MHDRRSRERVVLTAGAEALARAFLAGDWSEAGLTASGSAVFDRRPRRLRRVVREVLALYHRPPLDRPRELARVIEGVLREAPPVRHWAAFEPAMGRMRWRVPELTTLAEVADLLEADVGHLQWLADARGLERVVEREQLRNYRYSWHARPQSTVRIIERPKLYLKTVQRTILRSILDAIPPHDAAHGFTRRRSVATHAAAHAGKRAILRFDLESFFASVAGGRVYGIFRAAGYPETIGYALTALCVNVVPRAEWSAVPVPQDARLLDAHWRLGWRLATPHLPQGAPTSPALANLAALGLDRRLTGLAAAFGATYTRYADDLALSGGERLLPATPAIRAAVAEIAHEEGFRINARKSQLMTSAGRQRLCGVVVNVHPNVARTEYDTLKAILHNAARCGPEHSRDHLLGRISWIESLNPNRGSKLRARFARIRWADD